MSKNKIYKEYKKGVAKAEGKIGTGRVIRRILLSFFTFIILLVIGVYLTLYVVAKGPSETIRNMLVHPPIINVIFLVFEFLFGGFVVSFFRLTDRAFPLYR